MSSKEELIAKLNEIDDMTGGLPLGLATTLDGPIQNLRRVIHREVGVTDVDDSRLRGLPRCYWCGIELERPPHEADVCIRDLLVQVLDRLGKGEEEKPNGS